MFKEVYIVNTFSCRHSEQTKMWQAFLLNRVPLKIISDQNGKTVKKNYKYLWKLKKNIMAVLTPKLYSFFRRIYPLFAIWLEPSHYKVACSLINFFFGRKDNFRGYNH